MVNSFSITSSNAKLSLTVRSASGPVVGPFTVEGYASETAFGVEPVDAAEVLMGVDGKASGGLLPFLSKHSISLMANSPSIAFFEDWYAAQKALGDILVANGVINAPSLGRVYACVKGFLTRLTPVPAARKTFSEPVAYEITWESITPAPVAL